MTPNELGRDMYLRSSTIGTALSRFLALLANITPGSIQAGSTAATSVVMIGIMIRALHVLHSLIIVAAGWSRGKVGDLVLHVHFVALQQNIDNLAQLQVTRAKPARVSPLVLGLRLHPEQIPLRTGREFQNKDTSICSVLAGGFVGSEASISGDHDQVELRLVEACAAGAPAEVHELIFGVEIDVAWGRLGLDGGRSGRILDQGQSVIKGC